MLAPITALVTAAFLAVVFTPMMIAYATGNPERRRVASLNLLSMQSFRLWRMLLVRAIAGRSDRAAAAYFVKAEPRRRGLQIGLAALLTLGLTSTLYAAIQG